MKRGRSGIQRGAATTIVCLLLCGCRSAGEIARLRVENEQLRQRVMKLERTVQQRDAALARLEERVHNVRRFALDSLATMFAPVRIEIVSRSGGADYDGRPGDDGVTVYLRPIDADGDPVKAPGRITIELLDFSGGSDPRVVQTYRFEDPDKLRQLWYSRFGTNHYTLKCPFPPGYRPPASRRLTVRAVFLDALTGAELSAVAEVPVSFPSG